MRWCAVLLKDESSWQQTFAICNLFWKQATHVIFCIHFCINKMQSTFAIETSTSRYHNMRSELLAFNDQAIRSDICFHQTRLFWLLIGGLFGGLSSVNNTRFVSRTFSR